MQAPRIKIAVIGTINVDTVTRPDGTTAHGYGGILYNLIPLAQITRQLAENSVEIWPVLKIGRDHSEAILAQLAKLPNIRLDAVTIVNTPNNHCHLTYHDSSQKSEILRGWVGAVTRKQIEQVVDADAILVNFISGGDITSENLRRLREHSKAMIYTDFHSRTLGRRRDGSRFLRKPGNWREIILSADFLQMNEIEFELLSGSPASPENLKKFAETLPLGINQTLILTRGGQPGYSLTSRPPGGGSFLVKSIQVPDTGTVTDPTGCGDIFAAVSVAMLILKTPASIAFTAAAEVASRRATARKRLDGIDFRRIIQETTTSRNAQLE